ncbi:UDP-N-acetylmuramoyl-L-alanyl-D-glutamate--2,6-diaminopimelate ligase [Bacillus shivajii]|uniref:UDP-N-acetylmuramoyl-L-alanyl-D-glutamate--2, 6-diaminopimelate ligase n=1 Tax=Bacillus shivajii TaxID=1983719 RepID=UPI001CFAE607|nr:UDP-N-acetylmuramoyl-L-alanyl-D-glutamate--2,6-diaminopimelate ligase [Bacillus shivajii]UCZ51829.1 UDP-N-acetylmuramoyl-L-alanyl-D-glutamate--2,6-diaminopimelate ligase [Bacillus shivajii]
MQLNEIVNLLPTYSLTNNSNPLIQDLHMDSREVTQGSLFFCVPGYTVDGHDFAKQAVEKGAVALVAERDLDVDVPVVIVRSTKRAMAIISSAFYQYPTEKLHMIGVTGTNGKTTTTHLIEQILNDAKRNSGMIGTMYMRYGGNEIPVKNTTPESLVLQKEFAKMVESGVDSVTMEVSSHALELGRVHGCRYDVAVFTNLSQDHLDFHETMERYCYAKGLLFAQLGNGNESGQNKVAVINSDDESAKTIEMMSAVPVLTYGIYSDADVKATNINVHEKGTSFLVHIGDHSIDVNLKMTGTFSVYNALAAIAATYASGIRLPEIKKSLEALKGVSGRFERVEIDDALYHVIVDYAHTPDSLKNVLETIKEFAKGKISVVVGCGGDRDKTKRPQMAAVAEELADFVYLTSDNPRTEEPMAILTDMEEGMSGSNYEVIESRKSAIEKAIHSAGKDEIILIAGKGHETYQTIGKTNYHFDDRIVAKEAAEGEK